MGKNTAKRVGDTATRESGDARTGRIQIAHFSGEGVAALGAEGLQGFMCAQGVWKILVASPS